MKLGIIGLPQAGKTTIFNALTRGDTPTSASAGRIEVHTAVVNVPDPRVDQLSALYKPKKTTYAKVTYADIAGLESGTARSGISGQLLNQLAQMDGFEVEVNGREVTLHTAEAEIGRQRGVASEEVATRDIYRGVMPFITIQLLVLGLLAFWPGLALAVVVFGVNMFGDAVRDLFDPRLRGGAGSYRQPAK